MSNHLNKLAYALEHSLTLTSKIYLRCSNPPPPHDAEDFTSDFGLWKNPAFVAADGTQLAYFSNIFDKWVNTYVKRSWIQQDATPSNTLLEIDRGIISLFLVIG